jgi:hypothetical protein
MAVSWCVSLEEKAKVSTASITIEPSASHPDLLAVQDAMRQVTDFFDLLCAEEVGLVWNLKLATTNSPLTVEGEPYSTMPGVDAHLVAAAQRAEVEESLRALSQGRRPARRLSSKSRETLKRFFKRNMNGIGRTKAVLLSQEEPVLVTPASAQVGFETLANDDANEFNSLLLSDRTRSEYGSLEGTIVEVGTEYQKPSVLIKERNTGQNVYCRVSADVRERVSSHMTLDDVWAHRRVIVKGRIRYNADGSIQRIWAHDLEVRAPREVTVSDIKDADFTGGSAISVYLEKLREGEFG